MEAAKKQKAANGEAKQKPATGILVVVEWEF
jgi:hypothetical protein